MKYIFTLLISFTLFTSTRSQVVLNELYPSPGAGSHEFFELYNNGVSFSGVTLEGYTLIAHYEGTGTDRGFFVMDLPDLTIPSKSYLVGSSAIPFNYQGVTGSTKSHFSWNDLALLSANNGYLKKWKVGNIVPAIIDGNAFYDEQPVPANFNDVFQKRSGTGASFSVFVYRYGVLVNTLFGGTNTTTVPTFITDMPDLKVVMASGGDFTVKYSEYATIAAEYESAEAGTDNGYTRTRDGLCGGWIKSSSGIQHTPEEPNGSEAGTIGSIVISAMITRGVTASDSSTVVYKLVSAPAGVMPVILDLYVDNGTMVNDLDGGDTYLTSRTLTNVGNILHETKFMPYNANLLIAAKSSAGCFDMVLRVTSSNILLPVKLISFNGSIENNSAALQWTVSDNSAGATFEIQKSTEGINFTTLNEVLSTSQKGVLEYALKTAGPTGSNGFYRIKMTQWNGEVSYSRIIQLSAKSAQSNQGITLKNNPVEAYLGFTFNSTSGANTEISIYSMSGAKLYTTGVTARKGTNTVTLSMSGIIPAGTYVLEVKNNSERSVTKIYKK